MKDIMNLKDYEIKEFRKAFELGTDKAWKTYRANVLKMIKKFEKETGLQVDADALME